MSERDDYADPKPPRTWTSVVLVAAAILPISTAVGLGLWVALDKYVLNECSKYG